MGAFCFPDLIIMPWSLFVSDKNNENTCINSPECLTDIIPPKNIFDRITINTFSIVSVFSTVALTLIICVATFFRYVVKGDLYGYEEWVKILAFWLYFLGAAMGSYNRTHVSADLVNAYLPDGKLKLFFIFLRNLVTVCVSVLFAWYGYEFFMFGFAGPLGTGIAIPKTTVWRISLWVGYLSVFVGLVFMAIYFTRDLIHSIRALFGREEK
jgi:TRAP-type C4-dicarboxylate transport system permease small subunit